MKFKNPEIEKLYEHLSQMSREAYKDPFLISNIILGKQDPRERLIKSYLSKEVPPNITFLFITKKILLYFCKNILCLILSILTAILHRLSRQRFPIEDQNDIIILDVYFVIDQILKKDRFKDTYFPGLAEYLTKIKKPHVYTPKWFGSRWPLDFLRVFKILRKGNAPVLTQFQILRGMDYLKALRFIFFYPFSVFRFLKKLGSNYENKIVACALWNTFDSAATENHIRFLVGQRLASLVTGKIKCASWYENQVSDKNFYLGLRSASNKTEIIGAQLFVRPATLMNIVPDERETPFKVVPDKILVNGPGYCFDSDRVCVDTGPSFRYKYLFNPDLRKTAGEFILIIMPYFDHVTSHILDVIQEVKWPDQIVIKFHPTTNEEKYNARIPKNSKISIEPLPLLLPKALMVIGHSAGALVEAVSLGIPVINIQTPGNFSHDYTLETNKGGLWEQAYNAQEVSLLVKKFQTAIREKPEQFKEEGKKIRSFCFSEPTDEKIDEAFGL